MKTVKEIIQGLNNLIDARSMHPDRELVDTVIYVCDLQQFIEDIEAEQKRVGDE